jgi:site-specific DNA recombinase
MQDCEEMKGVAIYIRSSKDRHDVSCEAQRTELKQYAETNGYTNLLFFEDKALSSTRDVRPKFDQMVALATGSNTPFKTILCKDTSRFGRDSTEKNVLLWQLRNKHGIDVVFKDMPHTGSFMDEAFEQIMSAMDYIHSQQSKVKGIASMKQNVRNGYRAGGKAPYGYKLKKITIGKHRNGDIITKTRLTPDPATAQYVSEYFERRAKNEPRRNILEGFFKRGVPAPNGSSSWGVSTAKSMEDNIETYQGHTTFNKHNERLKKNGRPDGYKGGKKWRPRNKWVITQNTHEPLVTDQIADIIKENKEKKLRDSPYNKTTYPLTGILKCSVCNSNYTGDSGYYRCNSKSKIGHRCVNGGISQQHIEKALTNWLSSVVLKFNNLNHIIDKIKERCKAEDTSNLPELQKQLEKIGLKRKKLIHLHMNELIDNSDLETELQVLNKQKKALTETIQETLASNQGTDISKVAIKKTIKNLSLEIKHTDPNILKMVFNRLFQEIEIHPKIKKSKYPWSRILKLKGISIPFTGVKVASPRGFEPLSPP